jgi:methylmalonyl-CoA mutase
METNLFNHFKKTPPAAWKQKIQVDLNGDDYNENLVWKTDEGILVKPFYTKEDRKNSETSNIEFKFNISQSIYINKEKTANYIAKNALKKGANAIEFIAANRFNYKIVLAGLDLKNCFLYFRFQFLDAPFISEVSNFVNTTTCYIQIDIINNLAKTGNWFQNLKTDHQELEKIVKHSKNSIGVDATLYQNGGANNTQQLAYALAHANEYLNYFGIEVASKFHFNFSLGSNYFFEIAKIRAFRILWNALLKEYNSTKLEAHIFAQPSTRNKTIYDHTINMLRTTSECMSAILGGANTVNNLSSDAIYRKKNEFGERISRNQLLILQQESSLESANTIANGSYYIESITAQLAEKALLIFKEIEKGGGFLKQLKEGIIQRKITESATKEQEKFNTNELTLVGINKQPNSDENIKSTIEIYPFLKINPVKTLVLPIISKRLAEIHEKKCLENE